MVTKPKLPAWFWSTIETSSPSLQRLAEWMEAADKAKLIAFARAYRDAAEAICDFSDGPQGEGGPMSEDATADLCNWIVSQGKKTWVEAVDADALTPFAKRFLAGEGKWDATLSDPLHQGYLAPQFLPVPIFEKRFSEDLLDYLDSDEEG